MSGLRALYQEVIIDHSKHPRNCGSLESANYKKEGYNPLCGDKLTLFLLAKDNVIKNVQFIGSGCAISVASASLMTEAIIGKTVQEVEKIFSDFHQLITQGHDELLEARLGKLAVLAGVAEYPARVKCASLAWHTLKAAMVNDPKEVCTE